VIAYLGLGSNLGDREVHLRGAVTSLRALDPGLTVSSLFATLPIGGPPQPPYLNCVVRLSTDLPARELLSVAQCLERHADRVRTVRNGPRTLDVDVLLYGEDEIDEPDLVVPHPRMAERAFVLAPLEELAPELVPAGWRHALGGEAAVRRAVRKVGTLFSS
jgi:2-amino-4-hydroxy-6-hydroxymethyldihydropteridine diphosphokinase